MQSDWLLLSPIRMQISFTREIPLEIANDSSETAHLHRKYAVSGKKATNSYPVKKDEVGGNRTLANSVLNYTMT